LLYPYYVRDKYFLKESDIVTHLRSIFSLSVIFMFTNFLFKIELSIFTILFKTYF
jgi:hypothetical protein